MREAIGNQPRLLTPALAWRLVTIFGASSSFYLLLSVAPLYAERSAHATGAAGSTTAALMLTTVGGELAAPWVVGRIGERSVLGFGLVFLGVPACFLTLSDTQAWILGISAVRGIGFAATVVAGGSLTASLVPAQRRGEGLALVGAVSGLPSFVALPLGVWFAEHVGFTPVALAAGLVAVASVAALPRLPAHRPEHGPVVGMIDGFRRPELVLPAVAFFATTAAAGILVTFLPLALAGAATAAAVALFLQSAVSTIARVVAGRVGDRRDPARMMIPGLVTAACGVLLTARVHDSAEVLVGAAVFGIGLGIWQNSSATLMYQRVSPAGYAAVSGMWNLAYDAGMGAGALGFGFLAGSTGYPVAFAVASAAMLLALPAAWRARVARASE